MPTYSYLCKDCHHAFDVVQSFSDDSLTICPQCQGKLRKKFGNVGVTFKGSGFYRTDSVSSSETTSNAGSSTSSSSASPASSGSESSSTGSSEKAASTASASSTGSTGAG